MKSPLNIWVQCFNYHPFTLGGSERSARELAVGLRDRGHNIKVVLSDEVEKYPDTVDDIPVQPIVGTAIGKSPLHTERSFLSRAAWIVRSEIDPFLIGRIKKQIAIDQPDIIIMNNPAGHGSAMMRAAEQMGVPCVPIVRDFGYYCAFGTMQKGEHICKILCGKCKLFSAGNRKAMRDLHTVISISDYIGELNKTVLGRSNVKRIYNSISDTFINTPIPQRAVAPRPLKFGYLGRLHNCKGVNQMIAGWIASKIYEQGHSLYLAGDNQGIDLPDDLEAFNIVYDGPQPALEFLDTLDVLIIPSLWAEPFGRTVIEGIARGCYVVGSSNGALPELITEEVGEIFSEVTEDVLKNTFVSLAENPERVFTSLQKSRIDVLSRFRREHMLDQYETAIKEVLNVQ